MLDEVMIRALHVQALRHEALHAEHAPHVLFQASTIGALLDGAYDGDLTFAELAEHGDLGLGTTNGLDGEMIALDGRFYRADVDGRVAELDSTAATPFAVVVWFAPTISVRFEAAADHADLLARIERELPEGSVACALQLDGHFEWLKLRSVPRQAPPYRPLSEVVADQHTFELTDIDGSLVGFRFPSYSQGIEVAGWHLHFIDAGRARGGHLLDLRLRDGRADLDPSAELHVELPAGVELTAPDLSQATHDAIAGVEG